VWWVGALSVGIATAGIAPPISGEASRDVPSTVALGAALATAGAALAIHHAHGRGRLGRSARWCAFALSLLAAFAVGLGRGGSALNENTKMSWSAIGVDTDRAVAWSGVVVTAPEPARAGAHLWVRASRVAGRPLRALMSLSIAKGIPELLPGDVVALRSKLRSPRGTANPGVPDPERQLRALGVELLTGVGSPADLQRPSPPLDGGEAPEPDPWSWWLRSAAIVRRELAAALDRRAAGPAADFLHTTVLGQRRQADPHVEDGFRAAGATHVLSVSGLHLAVVAAALFVGLRAALRATPRLPLFVSPGALAAAVAIPAIWFYVAVTGQAIATARAGWMMTIALGAEIVGRRSATLVAIAVTAALLTLGSPLVMFDVSYQLSMTSVLALALVLRRRTRPGARSGPLLRRLVGAALRAARALAAATLVAGALTAPLVAHHFGEVTPAAPLGNLLLVPMVESVVVPAGLVGAGLGAALGDWAGAVPLALASSTARLALAIAEAFRRHAPVLLTRAPNGGETLALMAGVGLILHAVAGIEWGGGGGGGANSPGARWPSARAWSLLARACARLRQWSAPRLSLPPRLRVSLALGALCVAFGFASLWVRERARRACPDLVVTFLDVGQGDSAVVQLPGGRTMLVDGGGTYDGAFDPGARIVEPFLRAAGILHLDLVALSHPHPDHMGGLHRVLQRFEVGALWTSGDDGRNPDYRTLRAEAAERHVDAPVPSPIRFGDGLLVEPLGPFVRDAGGQEHIGPPEGASVNDASLVLRITRAGHALLFTGDLEAPGEGELCGRVDAGQTIASDVLKVPHHGSRTSSTDELLAAVRPRVAIISLGWLNRFHFPRPEVLDRYRRSGVRVLRTDLAGAITVRIGPGGDMDIRCQRGCPDPGLAPGLRAKP